MKAEGIRYTLGTEGKAALPKSCWEGRGHWEHPGDVLSLVPGGKGTLSKHVSANTPNNHLTKLNAAANLPFFLLRLFVAQLHSKKYSLYIYLEILTLPSDGKYQIKLTVKF